MAAPTRLLAAATLLLSIAGGVAPGQDCPTTLPGPDPQPPEASAALPEASSPRVEAVRFQGNRAVSGARLRRAMRLKPGRLWRRADVNHYDDRRWREDHRRLCGLYRDRGYVTARVGPPELSVAPGPAAGEAGARRVILTVPVEEGPRYRMGELSVEGIGLFDEDDVRALFDLRPGEPYRHARLEEGYEALRRRYGTRGYAQWAATLTLRPDPARGVVDVTLRVEEGGPRFVGRILFTGHRGTLDQTLRREVLLDEGDLLDTERLRESVRRIEALGYATVRQVRLDPSPRLPQAVDVTFEVQERSPWRYGLAGGVNALEGASLEAALGTVNLFGRAERLFASAKLGPDVTALELAASRPYAFGTPWTVAVQLRKERLELDPVAGAGVAAHTFEESAARLQAQRALGDRAWLSVSYSLGPVRLEALQDVPPPGFGRRTESRLGGSLHFDGWDHPWKPRRGLRATASGDLAGGPLGGSGDYVKARGRWFGLRPAGRRAALGGGAEAGWLRALGGQVLPFDQRFLLGGETQLRGFDARTVGPRDVGTRIGGTSYLLLQAESHVDVTRWLRALAFADAGQAWAEGQAWRLGDLRVSTGIEARVALPVFGLPVRLIFAVNPARDPYHPRSAFRVAVGPLP